MPVQEQIVELLGLPERGKGAPTLARVEDILTAGYAHALALEAERLRIERRLGEVAREAGDRRGPSLSDELSTLSARLTSADGELAKLRALLGVLHDRARALRSSRR
jgi:hypothetical protein